MKRLSVALAVYNEGQNLSVCLSSVFGWADEIIVVDGGSTDDTLLIARKYGAKIVETNNPPIFHINKQKALELCSGRWILQLDADEIVTEKLKSEIDHISSNESSCDGYFIPRRNFFLGEWLRKGGQYPDYVIRLFRSGKGRFPSKSVHEQIDIAGQVGHLKHPLDHYSYTSVSQYWNKSAAYIRLTADDLKKRKDSRSLLTLVSFLVTKPIGTFIALYIRHKGFVDGWRGLLFSIFSSMHFPLAYYEFLFLKKA